MKVLSQLLLLSIVFALSLLKHQCSSESSSSTTSAPGQECGSSLPRCPIGQYCEKQASADRGYCKEGCNIDRPCPYGQHCSITGPRGVANGRCKPGCQSHSSCPEGQHCSDLKNGTCVPGKP